MIAVIFEVVPFMGERHKYLDLAGELRAAIVAGTYCAFRDDFLARYVPTSEKVREDQREKWRAARLRS